MKLKSTIITILLSLITITQAGLAFIQGQKAKQATQVATCTSAPQVELTFGSNSPSYVQTIDAQNTSAGKLQISMLQKQGTSSMQYHVYYKKASAQLYSGLGQVYFRQNNYWLRTVLCSTNKNDTVNVKITKDTGRTTTSVIDIVWYII